MSLRQILNGLKHSPDMAKPILVELPANEELRVKLQNFHVNNDVKPLDATFGPIPVLDIVARIEHANKFAETVRTSEEKAIIEEYYLWIMEAFLAHLKNKYRSDIVDDEPEAESSIIPEIIRKPLFWLLTAIGISMDGMGSFLFAQSLLALIPSITNPWIMALSGVFTLVNAALFYSFEASMLKTALGVKSVDAAENLLKTYEQQRKTTSQVNKILRITADVSATELNTYRKLASALTKKTLAIKEKMPRNLEKWHHKWLRRGFTFFGAIMAIGSGYFMATSLLTVIAAGLLATPAGPAIIALSMASSLAFFIAMRANGMFKMGSEAIEMAKTLDKKLDKFESANKNLESEFQKAFDLRIESEAFRKGLQHEDAQITAAAALKPLEEKQALDEKPQKDNANLASYPCLDERSRSMTPSFGLACAAN